VLPQGNHEERLETPSEGIWFGREYAGTGNSTVARDLRTESSMVSPDIAAGLGSEEIYPMYAVLH
jgi:hypothetical protein